MKRYILFYILILNVFAVFSQIKIADRHTLVENPGGVNVIYIFSKIDNNSELHYVAADAAVVVRWFQFHNGAKTEINPSALSNTDTFIYPQNNTGYIVSVDGVETSFWVFDYASYLFPAGENPLLVTAGDLPCEEVTLNTNGTIHPFNYQNPLGASFTLNRTFTLIYNTLVWKNTDWVKTDTTLTVKVPPDKFSVPAPLTNTAFTLTGDQFAAKFGIQQATAHSDEYQTTAVKCKITTLTAVRDALNENDRPKADIQLEGSAPLDIQFFSNPTPNVKNYLWKIFKNNEQILTRTEKDHQYTFTEAGKYNVKLEVTNGFCTDSASVSIDVFESQIAVPKVFTPNGDGINDEFRVAYRSIVSFQGTIVNRWGRVLFSWTDPAKGWDGKIGGKPAAEGTYFYIINAKGSDNKEYKLKGYTTLLR